MIEFLAGIFVGILIVNFALTVLILKTRSR